MKIGVVLRIDHTAQIVKTCALTLLTGTNYYKRMKTTKTLNHSALLLYNVCTLFRVEMCHELTIHPKGMTTLKNNNQQ